MRAVVQKVSKASVAVEGVITGKIGKGLVVLLGIGREDTKKDLEYMANKVVNLRIFEDEKQKMNLSVLDVKGELLVVSQFTLYGDCRKGKRPSYILAQEPEKAKDIYEGFLEYLRTNYNINIQTGVFQAHMDLNLSNDGPVTLLLDSKKEF